MVLFPPEFQRLLIADVYLVEYTHPGECVIQPGDSLSDAANMSSSVFMCVAQRAHKNIQGRDSPVWMYTK